MTGRHSKTRLLALVALLATACGSTVRAGDSAAPQILESSDAGGALAAGDQGLALDPNAADGSDVGGGTTSFGTTGTSTTSSSTTTSGSTASTSGGTSGGTTGTGTTGGTTSGGTTTAGSQYGPGITDEEIVVGIAFPDDASASQNDTLLGAGNLTIGNVEKYYDVLAKDVNENGGIAGRRLRYSKYRYSSAQGQSFSQIEQGACAQWTEDDPAFAADSLTDFENMLGCLNDAGVLTLGDSLSMADERTFADYPYFFELSGIGLTRQMGILADGLEAQGYFDEGYELGVVSYDGAVWKRAVEGALATALEGHGRAITATAYVRQLRSTHELGDLTAQLQSTVLRFKTQGITHVIFVEQNAVMALLFTQSAENQGYRPRYGLTSQSGGTAVAASVPQGQYERAVGVGWLPVLDVPASEAPANPAADACIARFAEYGEEPAGPNDEGIMLGACEYIAFVEAAVEAGLPDITAASATRGGESLGEFPSLISFGNHFAPGRHDGGSYYRHVAYDGSCNCFHYTSDLIADLP